MKDSIITVILSPDISCRYYPGLYNDTTAHYYFSSHIKHVKKWHLFPKNKWQFLYIFRILNLLKMISPNMEQCVIELNRMSIMKQTSLNMYCSKINELISDISKEWNKASDVCPYIDLRFKVHVRPRLFHGVTDVEKCFHEFPDYRVKELPVHGKRRQYTVSKQTVYTESFSLDAQILITASPRSRWRPISF